MDVALTLASKIGLTGLTIGSVAEAAQMSKSGIFAHFGSREELQISIIREYQVRFETKVFLPSLKKSKGLPRLRALFDNWINITSSDDSFGCIYISGAVEFDDRDGPVRDELMASVRQWQSAFDQMIQTAQNAGHLNPLIDTQQIAFEIHGLILAYHYETRFMRNPMAKNLIAKGFENVLLNYAMTDIDTQTLKNLSKK